MMELIGQLVVLVCFILISFIYFQDKYDSTGWVLLFGIICAIINGLIFKESFDSFFDYIPITSLIFLIFMDIFIRLLLKEHVFEYLALHVIRFTQKRMRLFFYLICITSAIISGIMEDVSVVLIIHPIVFRATKILNIDPKPYIYGTSASIMIGNLLTPVASPVNIIFVSSFQNIGFELNLGWFFLYLFPLFVVNLAVVLVFIDQKFLKKMPPVDTNKMNILIEIMNPNLLIRNKGRFFRYIGYLIIIIIAIGFNYYPYIILALFITMITLIEEHGFTKMLSKTNWSLPFLYIGLFLLIGSIRINGTMDLLSDLFTIIIQDYLILAIIVVFFISCLISSFISRSLALLIFATILDTLFLSTFLFPSQRILLIVTLMIALQLAGNLVPQSSSFLLKTIEQAKNRNISQLAYKPSSKILRVFTLIEIVIGSIYIAILGLIL